QLANQVLVAAVALAGALLLLRVLFLALVLPELVWSGAALIRLTGPLTLLLAMIPGGATRILGSATLADFTAAIVVTAIPIFIFSRPRRAASARSVGP
ncbi:MAG: hypothetical protein IT337_03040, partial [Thermomicrobiales bacterium]|nr:hypothetical protein [Thermomicrobiales bacterium]